MILTRIMRGMAQQDWAAVVLDLIVVIFGIFLGLQATNWYEDRQARAEVHYYLDLLRRQLDSDIQDAEKDLAENSSRVDRIGNAYELLFAENWSDDEYAQFKSDHSAIYYIPGVRMRPSALRRLLDGGKIDLIQSKAIQEILFDLDRAYEEAISQSEVTHQRISNANTVVLMEIPYGTREDVRAITAEPSVLLQSDKIRLAIRIVLIMNDHQIDALKTLQSARISARNELETYLSPQTTVESLQRKLQ